ncbi:hypothetical protein KEM56_002066 [Ascosphaera pollenicola]|nr:hypothetical protein KEM56_002066 [Ascosphaera pollenicola]
MEYTSHMNSPPVASAIPVHAMKSPQPAHPPVSKRDKRRTALQERLQDLNDNFGNARDVMFRQQIQTLQVEMALIANAQPYGMEPLNDAPDEITRLVEQVNTMGQLSPDMAILSARDYSRREDALGNDLPDALKDSWKFDTIDPQSYSSRMDSLVSPTVSGADGMFPEELLTSTDSASDAESRPMVSIYDDVEDDFASQYDSSIRRLPECPTVDNLIDYVRRFPQDITQGRHLPFVHGRLKSPSEGNVAEVVAVSFSRLQAKSQSYETDQTLASKPVQRDLEDSMREFDVLEPLEDNLAMIHVSCLVHISRDLDEYLGVSVPCSPFARSQHKAFLDMTRQICRAYTPLLGTHDSDWSTWQLAETLRRTVHLANVINKLYCYSSQSNAEMHEPLDEELILDLALPSSNSLWKAADAAAWQVAKRRDSRGVVSTDCRDGSAPIE